MVDGHREIATGQRTFVSPKRGFTAIVSLGVPLKRVYRDSPASNGKESAEGRGGADNRACHYSAVPLKCSVTIVRCHHSAVSLECGVISVRYRGYVWVHNILTELLNY